MITASELRIGNIITNHDEVQVVDIWHFAVLCAKDSEHFIKPIELTEDVLLKCGFEKADDEWSVADFCMQIFQGWLHYSAGEGVKLSEKITTLHQLQNIYYAITGKELEFKI